MTLPYWRHAPAAMRHEVDVVVVGAGVCGLSAGWELAARGLRTAIIERHHVGAGASSRNAGFLMRGMADNYAAAVGQYGRARAREMWRWTEQNLAILRDRGVGALPSFRAVPSCLLALEATELAELRESERLLREDGFEVAWLHRHDDAAWANSGALGGLVNPRDAQVNPWDLVRMLAAPIATTIHEGQSVIGIEPGPGGRGVLVRTIAAEFLAHRVLVCTNAYAPLLLEVLATRITPHRGQMLAIRPDGLFRLDYSYYANRGADYFRATSEGIIVVGGQRKADGRHGAGEVGYDAEPGAAVQQQIERFARATLGLSGLVVSRWAGTMGFSGDGLPIIEPVPVPGVDASTVWFCGGFTGHGMSLAARCAQEAVRRLLDAA